VIFGDPIWFEACLCPYCAKKKRKEKKEEERPRKKLEEPLVQNVETGFSLHSLFFPLFLFSLTCPALAESIFFINLKGVWEHL